MSKVDQAIERVRAVYGSWRRDTPLAAMRADWDRLFAPLAPPDAALEPVRIGDLDAAWLRAHGTNEDGRGGANAILYLHGGGFRLGSPRSHHRLMADLSRATGAPVLGLDYRLAPEHPFPAALDDTLVAWRWLRAQGYAASDLARAGDSAGGCLALGAILRLRDGGEDLPAAAYLLSAWTDLTASGESFDSRADADPIHDRRMIRAIAQGMLAGADPSDPAVSPLFADLSGLPPLLFQVGDRETVLSDSVDFAQRARAAGVSAEAQVWPGMIHVFQQFPDLLPEAGEAIGQGGRFLQKHFGETAA
jgi:acetyl esterase/lipase